MANDPTTTGTGLWRVLILDRDPTDPKWVLASIAPGDVRPVTDIKLVIPDLDEVTRAWAASASGLRRPAFTRLVHPEVWRVDENGPRQWP
jgi:hypothetical protein